MNDEDGMVYGPWQKVGEMADIPRQIATYVKGLSSTPVVTQTISIHRTIERRKVWKFVGYEERISES